jgi:hypothetical protein
MAKSKPQFNIVSYGIYSHWDEKSKKLPKIKTFTTDIPAELDIEFGYMLHVKKGKGLKLNFCIYHPSIPDENGDPQAPFTGNIYVADNDWHFYLGDTLWEPIENKVGIWRIVIEYQDQIIAEKSFDISLEKLLERSEDSFFNHRAKR